MNKISPINSEYTIGRRDPTSNFLEKPESAFERS